MQRLSDKFGQIGKKALALSQTAQDEYNNLSTSAADTTFVVSGFKGDKEARNENMRSTGSDGLFGQMPWDKKAEEDTYARRIIANWAENVIPAMQTLQRQLNDVTADWARQEVAWCKDTQKAYGIVVGTTWGSLRDQGIKDTWGKASYDCDTKLAAH